VALGQVKWVCEGGGDARGDIPGEDGGGGQNSHIIHHIREV
jgi:hypothetical protein